MASFPFALQLYSVRDYLEKDVAAALRQVKGVGYDYVELAGLYDRTAAEFKVLLDEAGLTAVSMHVGYDEVFADVEAAIENAKTLQLNFIVVPWMGGEEFPDKATWLDAIEKMDAAGARIREAGLQLCYHNHEHEFETLDGDVIFDLIYGRTAPENLAAELDTCWTTVGGADTPALIRKFGKRAPLLHIKDYVPGKDPIFTEVGSGCMDIAAVLQAGKEIGAQWYIVEQDESEGDSMESVKISAGFMARQSF